MTAIARPNALYRTLNMQISPPLLNADLPVYALMRAHELREAAGVQLYAGTNFVSPAVAGMLASGVGSMPAIGKPFGKQQPGTDEISSLEELVHAQLLALFGGSWAEARLQSCTLANAAIYTSFSRPGDLIATVAPDDGGHVSHQEHGTAGMLGRRTCALPFSRGSLDGTKTASLIRERRPRIVMLGASVMLAPYQLEEVIGAARDSGSLVAYDASHVLGLVAGGVFQNPLAMGVDIMTASTYKSFGGPPGGIIVGRDAAHGEVVAAQVAGPWASNYDATRLAALSVAIAEAVEFMPAYARRMLENAGVLRDGLRALGISLAGAGADDDLPQTHQLVVRCQSKAHALDLMKIAEARGLYLGTCSVPGESGRGGLRLGTQAVTRRGAGPGEMTEIAGCISGLTHNGAKGLSAEAVKRIAVRLQGFTFCYEEAPAARNQGTHAC